jgi:nitroimidazol reductase NimA-like FMN-containing flavoprotein (pyridoxamine 5'-phosphate oxidase superfamily)
MDEAWLETLELERCLEHLRTEQVGRIAIVVDGSPIVLPIAYRLLETSGRTWIAVRTRPGNVIDQAPMNAAFEIDGIDPSHHRGWSVLVRGSLQHVNPDAAGFRERFDPQPWMTTDRDAWLVIEPYSITGRELHPSEQTWAFHSTAYL